MYLKVVKFFAIFIVFASSSYVKAATDPRPSLDPKTTLLVLQLETVLIDAIPKKNASLFSKEEVFEDAATAKWYRLHPYAKEFLKKLPKTAERVILSELPASTLKLALSKLEYDVPVASSLATVPNQKKLKRLVVSTADMGGQLVTGELSVFLGTYYYQFSTYLEAQDELSRLKKSYSSINNESFFPATEEIWIKDRNKLGFAYVLVNRLLVDKQFQQIKDEAAYDAGVRLLKEQPLVAPRWNETSASPQCELYNYAAGAAQDIVTREFCVKEGLYTARWKFSDDSKTHVTACGLYLPVKDTFIGNYKLSYCEKIFPLVTLWVGPTRSECAFFTQLELARVNIARTATCEEDHLIHDAANSRNVVVKSFKGIENLSVSEVLRNYFPPPDQDHLDRYWFETKPLDLSLFDFKKCKGGQLHTIVKDSKGKPKFPECVPDTVYSWGPQVKLDNLRRNSGKDTWEETYRALYTTRSPIGSHGYGPIPIRIKLRKDVQWKASDYQNCVGVSKDEQMNTIYFREDYFDITLCSPRVIESWSYGLKEHYDEILREYRFLESPECTVENCDLYYFKATKDPFQYNIDGHSFLKSVFWSSMKLFIKMVTENAGELFCNPYLDAKLCTNEKHFGTSTPIYYNPD